MDGFYIAPAFMDKLVVHITKNFMTLPNIKAYIFKTIGLSCVSGTMNFNFTYFFYRFLSSWVFGEVKAKGNLSSVNLSLPRWESGQSIFLDDDHSGIRVNPMKASFEYIGLIVLK